MGSREAGPPSGQKKGDLGDSRVEASAEKLRCGIYAREPLIWMSPIDLEFLGHRRDEMTAGCAMRTGSRR